MADRIVVRCDGGAEAGAGHVGRCLPIADALRSRGAQAVFVGRYDGVAAWLLSQHDAVTEPTVPGPCGVDPQSWVGAIVDLYTPAASVCELAAAMPIATIGESSRCATAGLWIDYHAGSSPGVDERRLGGPAFAPVDARFAASRAPRAAVSRILVSTGASAELSGVAQQLAQTAADVFPEAEVLTSADLGGGHEHIVRLAAPVDLVTLAPSIDLAVVAAGMTVYELASAGVPMVAVALVANQQVVVDGCRASGIAIPVDAIGRDPRPDVRNALQQLRDPGVRDALAAAATGLVDGRGAERVADALLAA